MSAVGAHELNAAGVAAKAAGDLDRAEASYREALAQLSPGDPLEATLWHNLAGIAHERGDLQEAEQCARRGIDLRRAVCDDDDRLLVADVGALAAILAAKGERDEAEQSLRRVLDWFTEHDGPASGEVAFAASNLGVLLHERGEHDEAERLHRRALRIRSEAAPGNVEVAASLNNLAAVRADRGDVDEATSLLEQAIAIVESAFDNNHPRLATMRANLAALQRRGTLKPATGGAMTDKTERTAEDDDELELKTETIEDLAVPDDEAELVRGGVGSRVNCFQTNNHNENLARIE